MSTADYIDARAREVHGHQITENAEPAWKQKARVARENLLWRMGKVRTRGLRFIRRHWLISYICSVIVTCIVVYYFGLLVVGPMLALAMSASPLLGFILLVLWFFAVYAFAYWMGTVVLQWLWERKL